mmetsp:Transcript_18759/g.15663  ORF Transcript_18759/g.15663 Transcript_18759/m.15663 type:complete len:134 (-) Transcript_18759:86-487(-)
MDGSVPNDGSLGDDRVTVRPVIIRNNDGNDLAGSPDESQAFQGYTASAPSTAATYSGPDQNVPTDEPESSLHVDGFFTRVVVPTLKVMACATGLWWMFPIRQRCRPMGPHGPLIHRCRRRRRHHQYGCRRYYR